MHLLGSVLRGGAPVSIHGSRYAGLSETSLKCHVMSLSVTMGSLGVLGCVAGVNPSLVSGRGQGTP